MSDSHLLYNSYLLHRLKEDGEGWFHRVNTVNGSKLSLSPCAASYSTNQGLFSASTHFLVLRTLNIGPEEPLFPSRVVIIQAWAQYSAPHVLLWPVCGFSRLYHRVLITVALLVSLEIGPCKPSNFVLFFFSRWLWIF